MPEKSSPEHVKLDDTLLSPLNNPPKRSPTGFRTGKIVVGITSIVLSGLILFQSCAVGVVNTFSANEELSGTAGLLLSALMLIAGIVGIVTRNSKAGGIAAGCFYLFGAVIGFVEMGTFTDLLIWSSLAVAFGLVYLIGSIRMPSKKALAHAGSVASASPPSPPKPGGSAARPSLVKRWWFWVIIAVVVLAIGFVLFLVFSDSDLLDFTQSPAGTETAADDDDTANAVQADPSTLPAEQLGLNVPVELDGIRVAALDIQTSAGSELYIADDGKRFVGVLFEIENISDTDRTVTSTVLMNLYVDNTAVSEELFAYSLFGDESINATIPPGMRTVGWVVAQVPGDAQTLELHVKDDWISDTRAEFVFSIPQ